MRISVYCYHCRMTVEAQLLEIKENGDYITLICECDGRSYIKPKPHTCGTQVNRKTYQAICAKYEEAV